MPVRAAPGWDCCSFVVPWLPAAFPVNGLCWVRRRGRGVDGGRDGQKRPGKVEALSALGGRVQNERGTFWPQRFLRDAKVHEGGKWSCDVLVFLDSTPVTCCCAEAESGLFAVVAALLW